MSNTQRQKEKKNGNRVPAKDRALYSSMQKRYGKSKREKIEANTNNLFK
jgi:hypothetical protein